MIRYVRFDSIRSAAKAARMCGTVSGPKCAATRVFYTLLPSHTVKVLPSMKAAVKEFHIVFLVHVLVGHILV